MIAVRRVKMPIVDVVCVIVVLNSNVSAIRSVNVRMIFVSRVIHLWSLAFQVLQVFKTVASRAKKSSQGELTASGVINLYGNLDVAHNRSLPDCDRSPAN